MSQSPTEDIYSIASQCREQFETYLGGHRIHRKRVSQLQHRFSIWSSFLGVFADEKVCLDQRLRQSPSIKGLVMMMLQMFRVNLTYAIRHHGVLESSDDDLVMLDDQDSAIYGMNGAMERLHRLATVIRGGPRDDEAQVVRKFASRLEPDGFFDVVLAIIGFHFGEGRKQLRSQLAKTVVYRRHRLLYNRKHHEKLSKARKETKPDAAEVQESPRSEGNQARPDYKDRKTTLSQGGAPSGTLNTGTTQPSQRLINDRVKAIQRAHLDEPKSSPDNETIRSKNPAPTGLYPDPPKPLNLNTPVSCPYCHCELGKSVLANEDQWRKHFDADMRPYACISEECGDLPPTFSSTGQWLSHMRETHGSSWIQHVHRTKWVCQQCPKDSDERKTEFPTKDLLLHHLSKPEGKHGLLDPFDLAVAEAESRRLDPAGVDKCPLCSKFSVSPESRKDTNALFKHLAEHLVSIARLSLYWWKNDTKEEDYLTTDSATHWSVDPFPETWDNSELPLLDEIPHIEDKRPVQSFNSEVNSDWISPPDSELNLRQLIPLKDLEVDWQELSRHFLNPEGSLDARGKRIWRTLYEYRNRLRDATVEIHNERDDLTYSWIPVSSIYQIIQGSNEIVEILQTEDLEVRDGMIRFVSQQAKKLFALLIRRNHLKWLSFFYANHLGDECFPIDFESARIEKSSQKWTVASYKSNKSNKSVSFEVSAKEVDGVSKKDKDELRVFCNSYQWEFFVPVFAPNEPARIFHPRCQMPFIKEFEPYATNFSIVRHFVIHRSHLNFPRDDQIGTIVDEDDNPHIAVKEMLSVQGLTADKFQELAKNEAAILAHLRDQKHPHLIRVIASYTQGNRHFFVFPWARGGNLRNFWRLQPSLSAASDDTSTQDWNKYLEWFFEQLLGLASAIKNLHHPRNDPNESCRHGNLKPENILCFSKKEDDIGQSRIPVSVRLVIADAGHTEVYVKVHEEDVEFLGLPTATTKGVMTYSPPEAIIKQARTRRHDVWSLGCLYLESLIWMMYGYDGLKSFHLDVGPGEPYFVIGLPVDLKDTVKEWIRVIKVDPRCAPIEKTAVGRLVSLIEERMLIARVTTKDTDTQQSTSLNMGFKAPTLPRESGAFAKGNSERADAKEVHEEMKKIYDAGKQNHNLTWMIRDAEAAARAPPSITRGLVLGDNRRLPRSREYLEERTDISEVDLQK